jgi:septum formation protein
MKRIILASASPRRRELLKQIKLDFETDPAEYEEHLTTNLEPHELVRELSAGKAKSVAAKYSNAIIIAADTIGLLDGQVIGKPRNNAEARKMLTSLSGKCHLVITGFTIIDTETGTIATHTEDTMVYFKQLTPGQIESYIKSGEPLGKAGAYAIQGLGAVLIDHIEGDFYNVVGLPLSALADSLKAFGINPLS